MAGLRVGKVRPNVIKALTQVPEIKRQVRVVAREVQKMAKKNAPRQTGALRRSIKVENVFERGHVFYRVGWDKRVAFYGPLVELGTEDTPAQPHLRPAADEINNR
jgi:HK97 gp10 family phage protein